MKIVTDHDTPKALVATCPDAAGLQLAKPLVIGAIGLVIAQKIHTMFSREHTR